MTKRTKWSRSEADRSHEYGFVMAQAALLLIPMLVFAAFATDIGSWYLEGQKVQRGADAAALAGVIHLPNSTAAEQAARDVAARNGFVDATPGNNADFETGPLPQIRVTSFGGEGLEVEIRTEASAFLGRVVLDSIEVERYGVAEFIQPVHLGNPSSGLGTGTIDPSDLGVPNDSMWLSINAYCSDHEQGDPFAVGFYDGVPDSGYDNCNSGGPIGGVTPNPTYDPDAYVFVAEYQPGSPPIDLSVYQPGTNCGGGAGNTGGYAGGPILNFEIFGPSSTPDHWGFINANTPTIMDFSRDACNGAGSDNGWWPLLTGAPTPSANGGYYYIRVSSRNPGSPNLAPADNFWDEYSINNFSLRAVRSGDSQLCALSTTDPTCPQMYALNWLPLFRKADPGDAGYPYAPFYLAEVAESHAGEKMIITFFDAAEGIRDLQFVDSNGTAMPFSWRFTDQSDGLLPLGAHYEETALESYTAQGTSTCDWLGAGSNPCLYTQGNPSDFNDHWVQVEIDIPDNYTCGADCWWQVRYTIDTNPQDRTAWAITLEGDPVQLVE